MKCQISADVYIMYTCQSAPPKSAFLDPLSGQAAGNFSGRNSHDACPISRSIDSKKIEVFPGALINPAEWLRYPQRGACPTVCRPLLYTNSRPEFAGASVPSGDVARPPFLRSSVANHSLFPPHVSFSLMTQTCLVPCGFPVRNRIFRRYTYMPELFTSTLHVS